MALPLVQPFVIPGPVPLQLEDHRSVSRAQRRLGNNAAAQHLSNVVCRQRPETPLCGMTAKALGVNRSLEVLRLLVSEEESGETLGAWSIYNIVRIPAPREQIAIEGQAVPGVAHEGGLWGRVMLHLLETPLALDGGRVLNLLAWIFPEEPEHRWGVADPEQRRPDTKALSVLEAAGHRRTDLLSIDEDLLYPVRIAR